MRPSKRARKAPAGPFHLATDARGVAEQERLEGVRQQQEEAARREAEFKVPASCVLSGTAGEVLGLAWQQAARGAAGGGQEAPGAALHTARALCLAPLLQALPLNKAALAGAWKPAPLAIASLTVPQDVHLRSDARAAQRRQFKATRVDAMEVEEVEQAAQPEWQ